jgi:rRNA maturation RNase YbeY
MSSIHFFNEGVRFKVPHPRKTSAWIKKAIHDEGKSLGDLNFVFCSDEGLRKINVSYLNHDYFTDIITFDTSEDNDTVAGDIFISLDRVKENATQLGFPFATELNRVMIHGVLHLVGYSDKTRNKKSLMRKKEDAYLSLWG